MDTHSLPSKRRLGLASSLAARCKDLSSEWHPTKNGDLFPECIAPNSMKKVWWICMKDHEWQATVNNRTHGTGCPYCSGRRVNAQNSLAALNPSLAKEWHPDKNGIHLPETFRPGSGKRVFWLCTRKHEWAATIHTRSKGIGCPYCANRAACKDNSLSTLKPTVASEWHPRNNFPLTPESVVAGSHKLAWWKCKLGHEWRAGIKNRTLAGQGCPSCAGSLVSDRNRFSFAHPELHREWHGRKNGNLSPDQVSAFSGKKVWWKCIKGHEWRTTVASRSSGTGCPHCWPKAISLIELRIYAELKGLFDRVELDKRIKNLKVDMFVPAINTAIEIDGKYWHRTKLALDARKSELIRATGAHLIRVRELPLERISPNDVMVESLAKDQFEVIRALLNAMLDQFDPSGPFPKVIRKYLADGNFMNTGFYSAQIHRRIYALPGKSLAALMTGLANEWHPKMNGRLTPEDVTPGHTHKVWWRCARRHEWQAILRNRAKGSNCPYCSGKLASADHCLAARSPRLAAQWDKAMNGALTPAAVTPKSHLKVWWSCAKGHGWRATISGRSAGFGCPFCAGRRAGADNCLAKINPHIATEWHLGKNHPLTPAMVTAGSGKRAWWKCRYGHEWEAVISSRNQGAGCRTCWQKYRRGKEAGAQGFLRASKISAAE